MSPEEVKPGVTVRVLRNTVGAIVPDDYTYCENFRNLKDNDTFVLGPEVHVSESHSVPSSSGRFLRYVADFGIGWYNIIPLEDLEVVNKGCVCPLTVIMTKGCQCGGN